MAATTTLEGYREQITHYAQTMALGQNGPAEAGLLAGMPTDRVGMFTSGNLYKRFDKLKDACEMLADGLEDIDHLIKAYVKEVALTAYDTGCTDAMFPVVTKGMGASAVPVPLGDDLVHDLPAMLDAITERTRVVILCNPNNPTGTSFGAEAFDRFMEALPDHVLLAVDEGAQPGQRVH